MINNYVIIKLWKIWGKTIITEIPQIDLTDFTQVFNCLFIFMKIYKNVQYLKIARVRVHIVSKLIWIGTVFVCGEFITDNNNDFIAYLNLYR
jgi:hypothetical protein